MNTADAKKLTAAIENLLAPMVPPGVNTKEQFVFVNRRKFYDSVGTANAAKRHFVEDVNEVLSGRHFASKYGTWAYVEFGDGYDAFIRFTMPQEARDNYGREIDFMVKAGVAIYYEL